MGRECNKVTRIQALGFQPVKCVRWLRSYNLGVSSSIDALVAQNGDLYAVGTAAWTSRDQYARDRDFQVFISCLTSGGEVRWTREFPDPGDTWALAATSGHEGLYVCGTFEPSAGKNDPQQAQGFLLRLSVDGQTLWRADVGSLEGDWPCGVAVADDAVYVAGHTHGTLNGQASSAPGDAFLVRLNSDGRTLWGRQLGGARHDGAYGVAADRNGAWIAGTGSGPMLSRSAEGGQSTFVGRFSGEGEVEWISVFGSPDHEDPSGLILGPAGLAVLGGAESRISESREIRSWMRILDPESGTSLLNWESSEDGPYLGGGTATAGGIMGCGTVGFDRPGRDFDALLTAWDAEGRPLGRMMFGSSNKDVATSVLVHEGRIFVSGRSTRHAPDDRSIGHLDRWVGWVACVEPLGEVKAILASP